MHCSSDRADCGLVACPVGAVLCQDVKWCLCAPLALNVLATCVLGLDGSFCFIKISLWESGV